jgi:hypothetical protein
MTDAWNDAAAEEHAVELAMLAQIREEFPNHFPRAKASEQLRWAVHYTWKHLEIDGPANTWVGEMTYSTKGEAEKAIENFNSHFTPGPGTMELKTVSYVLAAF